MLPKKPGPKARRCAICAKKRYICGQDERCPKVTARQGGALAAAGASASGVAWRSKRERKQVAKFVPGTKVEADRERRRRNRKLKEATFASKGKKM